MMTDSPLKAWLDRDGSLLRLRLANPKANLVDAAMITELTLALAEQATNPNIACVLLDVILKSALAETWRGWLLRILGAES